MSNALPKGMQSAYQRWEMASFGGERLGQSPVPEAPVEISQREIDAIKESARLEAYAIGYREGYDNGHREGENEGSLFAQEKMQEEINQFRALTARYAEQLALAYDEVGEELLSLALNLAQAMVKTKINAAPEVIRHIVKDAIEILPSINHPAQIYLHPLDASLIKEHLDEDLDLGSWRITSDPTIERGGCKIETAHNAVDASVAHRWETLSAALKDVIT
jgi:flagellar assembly protein FliH